MKLGADWVDVMRKARKETAEGDTTCKICGDPDKGTKILVLAERGLDEQVPQRRIRVCEPCGIDWVNGSPAVREKAQWETL